MSVDVVEMSLHVASTRQAAARILNGLKLSCEFWSRIDVEDMSNICRPVSCAYRRCVVTCRRFSPFRKYLEKRRSALRVRKTFYTISVQHALDIQRVPKTPARHSYECLRIQFDISSTLLRILTMMIA